MCVKEEYTYTFMSHCEGSLNAHDCWGFNAMAMVHVYQPGKAFFPHKQKILDETLLSQGIAPLPTPRLGKCSYS